MLVQDAIHDYLHHISVVEQKAVTSVQAYERDLRIYQAFLNQRQLLHIADISYLDVAHEAFDSLVSCLMKPDKANGWIMTQICGGCGLGGKPYREGDYHYYVTEKIVENDPKGVAPFILAGMELHDADLVLKR